MTALHRNSKPDTVFLSDEMELGIHGDLSEHRTNLVVAGGIAYEAPSARAALTYPRELAVVMEFRKGDDGTVLYHGDPGGSPDYTYRMFITLAGALECSENGALRASLEIPGLSTVTARPVLLHWSSRQEGAVVISEIMAANLETNDISIVRASHSAGDTSTFYDFVVGGGDGSDFATGLAAFLFVRVSRRFHSTTEAREDWIAQATPPDTDGIRRRSALEFDRQEIGLAEDGQFAGPAYLWAGASARDNDRRCGSPLVNVRTEAGAALELRKTPAAPNWFCPSPIDDSYSCALAYLFSRPENHNRARVRIFVQQINELGGGSVVPITYRMLSSNILPNLGNFAEVAPNTYASAAVTCTSIHSGTNGEWLDLGILPLRVDLWGFVHMWLTFKLGSGSQEDDTLAHVLAVTIDPFSVPDANVFDKTI